MFVNRVARSSPRRQPETTPALAAWRRELAAGERTRYDFDPLWRAACADAWALECQDIPGLSRGLQEDARRIIARAARAQRRRSA